MKVAPLVVVGLLVAGFLTHSQTSRPAEQVSCKGPLTVVSVAVDAGGVVRQATTEPVSAEAVTDSVVGTASVLGTWAGAFVSSAQGKPQSESVSQHEARAVSVRRASVAACAPCPGVGVQHAGLTEDAPATPAAEIAGYSGEQLTNARAVMDAGAALGVGTHGQAVAVMTAMGESGLRVLDRGDAAGPDSRGLFQQRDNGAWGTYEQRMDPTASATSFYRALVNVPDWQSLTPTEAAHRTQRNADPNHYVRYWNDATEVVNGLGGGATVAQVGVCAPGSTGVQPASAVVPAGGKTVADLVAFGHALEARGVRISENAAMGDPPSAVHDPDGWHYKHGGSGALDINTRAGTSVQEQRELAVIAQEAMALGFGVIFMRAEGDHDGHLHVDIGTDRDVGDLSGLLPAPAGSA